MNRVVNKPRKYRLYYFTKRVMDIFFSIFLILLLSWFLLIISLLVLIFSGYPIIYRDKRVGKNGKTIYVFKFRTMVKNAEERINELLTPDQLAEWKTNHKLENDPRITKIGKILRKTSVDEFPQLLNILIGDMSFTGPRPVVTEEYDLNYTNEQKELILSVRPGLISYWSIHGRSNVGYENGKRQSLELEYFKHHSIFYDFYLILAAVPAVFFEKGAK